MFLYAFREQDKSKWTFLRIHLRERREEKLQRERIVASGVES